MPFPPTPVSACKTGITTVQASNDIRVCDAASGHQGQILTAMNAQYYGLLSMRPRQAFDFAGRTGTITYNVDAVTAGGLSWWTSLFVTDQPDPAANNSAQVTGLLPRNGIGINFDNPCNVGIFTYTNYTETPIPNTNTTCITTQRGSLNHIEIRLSQTHVEVWASDYSTDNGKTFPTLKRIASTPINLNFTRGYVHYQQAERAPLKYTTEFNITPTYANNYWSNLGFDGPTLPTETGYSVPDALTPNNGALNVGYNIPTTGRTFTIPNIATTGITTAKLTFAIYYTFAGPLTTTNNTLHYSINDGPWLQPTNPPNTPAITTCNACPGPTGGGGIPYAFTIPTTNLTTGTNTITIKIDNTWDSYPPVLTALDLHTN